MEVAVDAGPEPRARKCRHNLSKDRRWISLSFPTELRARAMRTYGGRSHALLPEQVDRLFERRWHYGCVAQVELLFGAFWDRPSDCAVSERLIARVYAQLREELGYKLHSVRALKEKHVMALLRHWEREGIAPSTRKTRIYELRAFATWFTKAHVVDNAIARLVGAAL